MMSRSERSFQLFTGDKCCYFLFFILAGFVGLVVYYVGFYTDRVGQIEKAANQYHLASSHFILKIKNNVSKIERRILTSGTNRESGLSALERRLSDPTQNMLYLMDQDLVRLFALQREYNQAKFGKTLKRLGNRIFDLRETWKSAPDARAPLLETVKALQITSDQFYRLHFFSFQSLIQEAQEIRKEHNFWLFSIAVTLLVLGLFTLGKTKQYIAQLMAKKGVTH